MSYSTTTFVPRRAEMDYLLKNPSGPVGRDLAKRGRKVMIAAKAQAGIKTGALKASIHITHGREITGQFVKIGSPLSYALMHHEGTKPHIIIPQRAQYLVFMSGRRLVYAKSVRHPGTKPNRYLSDNLILAIV